MPIKLGFISYAISFCRWRQGPAPDYDIVACKHIGFCDLYDNGDSTPAIGHVCALPNLASPPGQLSSQYPGRNCSNFRQHAWLLDHCSSTCEEVSKRPRGVCPLRAMLPFTPLTGVGLHNRGGG